jgi:hypothetical protein
MMILLILPLPPLHLVMLFRFEEFTMVRMGLSSPRTLFLSPSCNVVWTGRKQKVLLVLVLSPKLSFLQDLFRFGAEKKRPKFSCFPPSSLPHAMLFRLGENKGRSFSSLSSPQTLSLSLFLLLVMLLRFGEN